MLLCVMGGGELLLSVLCVFFKCTAITYIYTYGHSLSLHYALPIVRHIPSIARRIFPASDRAAPFPRIVRHGARRSARYGWTESKPSAAHSLHQPVKLHPLLGAAGQVFQPGLAPRQLILAKDHGKARAAGISLLHPPLHIAAKIGRASCRERVCQYV